MKFVDKCLIVDNLLELAKKEKLNQEQKNKIVNIIDNLENITETERERFIMYYGFDRKGCRRLIDIAKIYGCTSSSIRGSVFSARNKLLRHAAEIEKIQSIINECNNN